MPFRKQLLPIDAYGVSGLVWHVTITTHNRAPLLRESATASLIMATLAFEVGRNSVDVLVYCIMPDHVHIVAATSEENLLDVIRRFKSWTTNQWQRGSGGSRMWQPSHYDHGIRLTEKMDDVIAYLINNPVRAGLVEQWSDWPWIGGSLLPTTEL